ncbi:MULTISPECIES: hypothetical protein [Streptomyces]|uniref:hypothetical protein n=1 Tax=Streptomyces TaxID=1883 RepID=UPI002248ECA8|nr:hypothetical protein [Streptomyces sp. JHD 1]MCX2969466.1 hypothetical protein [Streptomyces sp. JHD 1]
MGNRADDCGTDVEIYTKALTTTIPDRSTGNAPRPARPAGGPHRRPVYVWHIVPEHLEDAEQKRLASRAIPSLLMAGYKVNIDPDLFDEAAYQQAVTEIRSRQMRPAAQNPPQPAAPGRHQPSRRAP